MVSFVQMSSNHLSTREEDLFALLLQFAGSRKRRDLNENAFIEKHLSPAEFDNWNRIKNRFLKAIERYLLLGSLKDSPLLKDIFLLHIFSKKGLVRNYRSTLKRIQSDLKKPHKHAEWTSLIEFRLLEVEVERNRDNRVIDNDLEAMIKNLDSFYIEHKLRILCEQLNRQFIVNIENADTRFPDAFEEEEILTYNARIKCYYFIYKLFSTDDQSSLMMLRKFLTEAASEFSSDYIKTVYVYLLNYYIRKLNAGHEKFASAYIDIIDDQIQTGFLLENDTISGSRFKNCITIALLAGRKRWAKTFFSGYNCFLPQNVKEVVIQFNQAQILFYERRFEDCQQELIGFKPPDMYYKIAYDKLIIKLFYYKYLEGEYPLDKLRTLVESAKRYVKIQRKLSNKRKKKNLMFLSCLLTVLKKKDISLKEVHGKVPVVDFFWLKKEVIHKG